MSKNFTLINERFKPRLLRLNHPRHMRQLIPHNRLLNQRFPINDTFTSIPHYILKTNPREPQRLNRNPQPLMIEIRHEDFKALVFLSNEIFHGDFDVFESEVGRHTLDCAARVHSSRCYSGGAGGDEEGGETCCA